MAECQTDLPIRLDVFAEDGRKVAERFLGRLPRDHALAVDLGDLTDVAGHAELVYDFRDGGGADGWLHALFRYEDRASGHAAESSFGAHVFNTLMTYRDEPQSYNGPPPGLTTRLFLKLGDGARRSFAVLIYPASAPFWPASSTALLLHDGAGAQIAEARVGIACCGSAMVWPRQGIRRRDPEAGRPARLRVGARSHLPAVRLPRADGRPRRVLARSHVRILVDKI